MSIKADLQDASEPKPIIAVESPIRLCVSHASVRGDETQWRKSKRNFGSHHCIRLKDFIDSEFLSDIQRELPKVQYKKVQYRGVHTLEPAIDPAFCIKLSFLLNDESVMRCIERLTSCRKLKSFHGRHFCMKPQKHKIDWHDDEPSIRKLGLSINLNPIGFEGGNFQIRKVDAPTRIWTLEESQHGDAHIFELSKGLEHRVTDVHGKHPRRVYAGWFI